MLTATLATFDRLDAVLHNVRERLAELPAITDHVEGAFSGNEREPDPGMRDLMQE